MPKVTSPLLRKVGDRVRTARTARGVSQEALAHAAGIDRSYMSGIERGVRNVTLLKLQAVARALRLPIRELLPND